MTHQQEQQQQQQQQQQKMMSGQIQVIFGPMFAGKTTELLRRLKRYTAAGEKCIALKHTSDYSRCNTEKIRTHDHAEWVSKSCSTLMPLNNDTWIEYADVIGIDEGQFFDDVIEFSELMANRGKIVIIATLDGTYQRECFDIVKLISKSEDVVKLTAICQYCKKDGAAFSKRLGNEKEIQVIGGKEKYVAVCRYCYFNK